MTRCLSSCCGYGDNDNDNDNGDDNDEDNDGDEMILRELSVFCLSGKSSCTTDLQTICMSRNLGSDGCRGSSSLCAVFPIHCSACERPVLL